MFYCIGKVFIDWGVGDVDELICKVMVGDDFFIDFYQVFFGNVEFCDFVFGCDICFCEMVM